GAEIVIKSLVAENASFIFGYPGGAIMPVYDALYDYVDHIQHILTRHEQGAIHAAQGYARVTGNVGVVMVTSGPGATNLITGLADALIDSTPVVCLTGQVASPLLGTDAFQETDVVGVSMAITKWNSQITKASQIPEELAKAFYIYRAGRPGPAFIDITKIAQVETLKVSYEPYTKVRSYRPTPTIKMSAIEKAAALIDSAKKPVLFVGQGVVLSGAEKELQEFIDKTGIPAALTLLGLSALPTEHPLN